MPGSVQERTDGEQHEYGNSSESTGAEPGLNPKIRETDDRGLRIS